MSQIHIVVSEDHIESNPLSGIYKFHDGKLMLPSGVGDTTPAEFFNQLLYNPANNRLYIASGALSQGFAKIQF